MPKKQLFKTISIRFTSKQYNKIITKAHMLKKNKSTYIRHCAMSQPIPKVIFKDNKQYDYLHRQLSNIEQSLSQIGVNSESVRQNIIYGLLIKAKQQPAKDFKNQIAQAMMNTNINDNIVRQWLKYDSEKLYPTLAKLSKQLIQLERDFNRTFN